MGEVRMNYVKSAFACLAVFSLYRAGSARLPYTPQRQRVRAESFIRMIPRQSIIQDLDLLCQKRNSSALLLVLAFDP